MTGRLTSRLAGKAVRLCSLAVLAAALGAGLPACTSMPAPGFPALPATASAGERAAFLAAAVDGVLARQQDPRAPGVSVVVVKDGKVVLRRAKGMADLGKQIAIDAHTVFEVGSLSKALTAIAAMQLVERGKLSLHDSILTWLPELPAGWQGVTVHHLLSQQSGIADITHVAAKQFAAFDGMSNAGLIERYKTADGLKFAPGSQAEYANTNYILLAEVIGRASGQGYGAYLHEHVFAPAGMQSSFLHGEAAPASVKVALNFARSAHTYGIDVATLGATGVISSATDMAGLLEALLAGRLVSIASLRTMTQAQSSGAVLNARYGYGFFVVPGMAPLTMFAHTGELDGYRAYLRVNVSKGVYYVVLTNGGNAGDAVVHNIVAAVQQAYERD